MMTDQWGASAYTLSPPESILKCAAPVKSMSEWNPTKYLLPIEWSVYSEIRVPSLVW